MIRRDILRHFDFWLFGTVIVLSIFGIAMIRSAIAGNLALEGHVNRQIIYFILGVTVMIVVSIIDYHFWASFSRLMYIFIFLFLVVIFIAGQAAFGAARWLSIADLFFIQPSELAKIIIILVLADYFSRHQNDERNLIWIGKSALLTFGLVVWILLQPNLSTSIVILVIWGSMLFISGLPIKYMIIFGVFGVVLAFAAFPFLEEYQQQRILTFLFPDPNARYGNSYNVEQALITIGSGGLFGQGYGQGSQVQLRFLKVRHTDFIFSALAEEFGFVGAVLVMILILFVIYRCLKTAREAPDTYGALIAYGFGTLIFFQMAVNIGVNLNILPVTGLTLPFVSYGGSSLLSLTLGIGFVESVAIRKRISEG